MGKPLNFLHCIPQDSTTNCFPSCLPETTDQESRPPDIVGPGSDLESSDGGDDLQDDSVDLDLGSDLGLNDLWPQSAVNSINRFVFAKWAPDISGDF